MAICDICNLEMMTATSCVADPVELDGRIIERRLFGTERGWKRSTKCGDCGEWRPLCGPTGSVSYPTIRRLTCGICATLTRRRFTSPCQRLLEFVGRCHRRTQCTSAVLTRAMSRMSTAYLSLRRSGRFSTASSGTSMIGSSVKRSTVPSDEVFLSTTNFLESPR
jgi:hypothetical protein